MNDKNNENFGLDDIDEILGENEAENIPEFDFNNQEFEDVYSYSPDAPKPMGLDEFVADYESEMDSEPTMMFEPVTEPEPVMNTEPVPEPEPVLEPEPSYEAYEEQEFVMVDEPVEEPIVSSQPDEVYIVDETSTNMVIEDSPAPTAPPVAPMNYQAGNAPIQSVQPVNAKPKKANSKLQGWQIAIIAVLGVITLWLAIFTTDHTLAANGLSPLFSKMTHEYEDGSQSFVGLGYKIQFQFDENGDLTQKCVPLWQKGPNDTKFANNTNNNK